MSAEFEWDDAKAERNATKHGVTFQEAATVFEDPLAAIFDDAAHSEREPREIIVGHSSSYRLLLVSFTEQAGTVRLISARLATRQEKRDYEEGISRKL